VVLPPDGRVRIESEISGAPDEAERLGKELADQLRSRGAEELLNE
jgi:porphobilinogen deaminase